MKQTYFKIRDGTVAVNIAAIKNKKDVQDIAEQTAFLLQSDLANQLVKANAKIEDLKITMEFFITDLNGKIESYIELITDDPWTEWPEESYQFWHILKINTYDDFGKKELAKQILKKIFYYKTDTKSA